MGRTAFVPEGQADRSQARSAWNSANPKSRPVGYGMIRAAVRTDSTWRPFSREIPLGLAAPDHTVPYGTVLSRDTFPRHFVPGYDHAVPLGQIHSCRGGFDKLALMTQAEIYGELLLAGPSGSATITRSVFHSHSLRSADAYLRLVP
jgi:hypothetical protein